MPRNRHSKQGISGVLGRDTEAIGHRCETSIENMVIGMGTAKDLSPRGRIVSNQKVTSDNSRYRKESGKRCIDIEIQDWQQLFDFRDPAPFRERDIANDAAEYIEGCFGEIPRHSQIKLVLHKKGGEDPLLSASDVVGAIHCYYTYQDKLLRRRFIQVIKRGQLSLLIGLCFLALCLSISYWLGQANEGLLGRLLKEGLIIAGWVAMWGPLDTFLYSWWPILQVRGMYQKLAQVEVEVVYEKKGNLKL